MKPTPSTAPATAAAQLQPAGAASLDQDFKPSAQPLTASVAAAMADFDRQAKRGLHVHLASSERRAEEIGRALAGLAPDLEALVLPPWDCLPYDRASPSRDVMGRRMAVLRRLIEPTNGVRVLVTSPEALVQKVPPIQAFQTAFIELSPGSRIDRADLAKFAERLGYVADDRIDEAGEVAFQGEVIDIFPAASQRPFRIVVGEDDAVVEIRAYDPLSQRTDTVVQHLVVGPASELVLPADSETKPREAGDEHRMAEVYGQLKSLFDVVPKATVSRDPRTDERLVQVEDQIEEAREAHRSLGLSVAEPLGSSSLYLLGQALAEALAGWTPTALDLGEIASVPRFSAARNPGRAFCDFVAEQQAAGRKVAIAGLKHEQRALARALARGLDLKPAPAGDWAGATAGPVDEIAALAADLEAGFIDSQRRVTLIAASDVLGGRVAAQSAISIDTLLNDADFRIGDVIIHEDHGVGVLRDLSTVEIDGEPRDTLELEYAGGGKLLAPVSEIGRIWRYGAEEVAVSLDKLKGDGWAKRRVEVSRQIDETARELVGLAAARDKASCPPLTPPKAAYTKFAARFAYPETPDQAAAIEAMLADLASGRPMDRLVCGDVGFGKTEVALRAAAAVALAGRQVAIAAPTTVLARQHFETFQRRFAGSGMVVAQLSRLISGAEAKDVREGLKSGEIRVVVGTHALAASGVEFADLGLMIIDEEQKFGATLKNDLRNLAHVGHRLALTATPIPRTLQSAMVGIQDVSIIASPPARRRPIRTFLAPFDAASLRTALLREQRRGGQSFFVVPRIEDIAEMAKRLTKLAPELSVSVAHGGLASDLVDKVMVEFADGKGDVLLATNIIESGLDVPRANTMFIWRPDRFGLSQLHQLRGRVGRGRVQGVAYLLAENLEELPDATRSRLSTLEAFDRLGSGLAISARDLDLRGGGDLVGEEQAGHVKMIGAAFYQRLLNRAVAVARGEADAEVWQPSLKLGETGSIPAAYVPDAVTRINLYARLAHMEVVGDVDGFEEELEDRFGALPSETTSLLHLARLQCLARLADVREIGSGPKGVALSFGPGGGEGALTRAKRLNANARLAEDRLILPAANADDTAPMDSLERLLAALAA